MEYTVKIIRHDERSELQIIYDNEAHSYYDYGEPEDNSFFRDYGWIKKELENAFIQGKRSVVKSVIESIMPDKEPD